MVRVLTIAVLLATTWSQGASAEDSWITVSGSVLQASRPVVGARVRLLDRGAGRSGQVVGTDSTDVNGDFRFAIPWQEDIDDRLNWVVTVEADNAAPRILKLHEYVGLGKPEGGWSLGALLLDQGCSLEGVVVAGARGEERPLSGARVVVWHPRLDRPWEASTDAEGWFEVHRLPAGSYVVGIDHPDWLAGREELESVCEPGSPPHLIRLDKGTMVNVRIELEDGQPAEGALVNSLPTPPPMSGWRWLELPSHTADKQGLVSVPVGRAATPWIILGRHPGFISTVFKHRPGHPLPHHQPIVLTLKSTRRLRGRVRDRRGRNLSEVAVTIERLAATDQNGSVVKVGTDNSGQFDSGPLPIGFYRVRLNAEGYVPAERTILVADATRRPVHIDVELDEQGTAAALFEVTSSQGLVEGADVEVHLLESGGWLPGCVTGPEGRCRVPGVPVDERLFFLVQHPSFDALREYVERLEPGAIYSLSLAEPVRALVTVEGRVEEASGEPIPGAQVSLTKPSEHSSALLQARTGADGRFAIADVPEGGYALEASASGWAPAILPLRVEADLEPVRVAVVRGARVTGRLAGAEGEELHRARAVLVRWPETVSSECSWDIWLIGPQGFPEPASGEIEGSSYRVNGLPPGEWTLMTYDDPPWMAQVVVGESDSELVVDLVRPDPETCRGSDDEPRVAAAKPSRLPAGEKVPGGEEELTYSIEYADGLRLPDCLELELVDSAGRLVREDDCADARGTWTDLPAGDLVMNWTESDLKGWSVSLPSPSRTFVVPLTGVLWLEVPALELAYRGGRGFARGLAVTLTPIGEDARKKVTASEKLYFGLVPTGWWSVRAELDGQVWTDVIEIQPRQVHTLLLR